MGRQITYSVQKRLKPVEKTSFLILNDFSKSRSLISTFTWAVDYKKQRNYCKGSLCTDGCINQGGKILGVVG